MTPENEKKHAEVCEMIGLIRSHYDYLFPRLDHGSSIVDVLETACDYRDALAKGEAT